MQVSAKTAYAVRAAVELAAEVDGGAMTAEQLSLRQDIPLCFLKTILRELRQGGIVASRLGADGGYRLARPPEETTVADVIRAVSGPLASVSGARPETLNFAGRCQPMRDVWVAVRASLRSVLEGVTLADIALRARCPNT